MSAPIRIFCSYAHEDENLLTELRKHLSVLENQGTISNWYDRRMTPGDQINEEIQAHLDDANVFLLLLSSDFLSSKYCFEVEMKRALEKQNNKHAKVVPVVLRPCDWKSTELGEHLALPRDGEPVTSPKWYSQDEAFLDVVNGIRCAIQSLHGSLLPSSDASMKTIYMPVFHDPLESNTFGQGFGEIIDLGKKKCYVPNEPDSHIDFQRALPCDGMLKVDIYIPELPPDERLLLCDANHKNGFEDFHALLCPTGEIRFGFKPNNNSFSSSVEWHYNVVKGITFNKWSCLTLCWGWNGSAIKLDGVVSESREFTYPLHRISQRFGIGRLASLVPRSAAVGVGFRDLVVYVLRPDLLASAA